MKLNRTTLRTVDILKMVSKKPDGITLDEICEKLELPKTSAYDIITTLAHTGMVHVVKGQKQRYTIGLTAYRVGINYTNNLDFIGTIDPVLKAFAKEMGKTVFFGVRSDDSMFISVNLSRKILLSQQQLLEPRIRCTAPLLERLLWQIWNRKRGMPGRPDQLPSPYQAYHTG